MPPVQTAFAGLLLVFEKQHLVDNRDFVLNLDLCKRVAHRFADVLRVSGGTAQNDAQADNCGQRRRVGAGC